MMRLLVASTTASAAVLSVVQESAAGKLDRSRRHRQQALAAPVFSSMAGAIEVFC
jgi:sensor domain CHASE-containing protein